MSISLLQFIPNNITQESTNLHVEEGEHRLHRHIDVDSVGEEEGEGSRRLRDDHDGVDDGVDDASNGSDAEQHDSQTSGRVGQDVEESSQNEGEHILQIVEMRTTHSLNVGIVQLDFQLFRGQILGVGECLEVNSTLENRNINT